MIPAKSRQGFTLIEIMIVIFIIGVLVMMAFPNFNPVRATARTNICLNNLRIIAAAKDQFAIDSGVGPGADVTPANIAPYLKSGLLPVEPQGGVYTIGVVGANPTCSIGGGHLLP